MLSISYQYLLLDRGAARVQFYVAASISLCGAPGLRVYLFCESTPARPQLLTSVFTHSDYVYLSHLCPLVPGIGKFLTNLIEDVARFTWPFHLGCRLWRADVISSMPTFCSSEAEGVSYLYFVPQIRRIMAGLLWRSRCNSGLFGPQVSLAWSIA